MSEKPERRLPAEEDRMTESEWLTCSDTRPMSDS
jgi:hypothetical protein